MRLSSGYVPRRLKILFIWRYSLIKVASSVPCGGSLPAKNVQKLRSALASVRCPEVSLLARQECQSSTDDAQGSENSRDDLCSFTRYCSLQSQPNSPLRLAQKLCFSFPSQRLECAQRRVEGWQSDRLERRESTRTSSSSRQFLKCGQA